MIKLLLQFPNFMSGAITFRLLLIGNNGYGMVINESLCAVSFYDVAIKCLMSV